MLSRRLVESTTNDYEGEYSRVRLGVELGASLIGIILVMVLAVYLLHLVPQEYRSILLNDWASFSYENSPDYIILRRLLGNA